MLVDERIEGRGNTDAAFRLRGAESILKNVGICGVHLEAHSALAASPPPALTLLPAKIEDSHAFSPVTADSEFVAGAFGAKIQIAESVFEHAGWRFEMIESPGLACGNR